MIMKKISFLVFLTLCVCLSQLCMAYTKYPISEIRTENNDVIIYTDNLRENDILFLIQNDAIQARFKVALYNKSAHLVIVKLDSEYNIRKLTNNGYLILENQKLKINLSKAKKFFELGNMYFKSRKYQQALEAYTVACNIKPVSIKELHSKVTLTNIIVDKVKAEKAFENKEYEKAIVMAKKNITKITNSISDIDIDSKESFEIIQEMQTIIDNVDKKIKDGELVEDQGKYISPKEKKVLEEKFAKYQEKLHLKHEEEERQRKIFEQKQIDKGLVKYGVRWMTPENREKVIRENWIGKYNGMVKQYNKTQKRVNSLKTANKNLANKYNSLVGKYNRALREGDRIVSAYNQLLGDYEESYRSYKGFYHDYTTGLIWVWSGPQAKWRREPNFLSR